MQLLLILIGYLVGCLGAHKPKDLTISLNGTDLLISVPDDPEVKSLFFSTESGSECKSDFSYNNSDVLRFKLNLPKKAKNNNIRIFCVLEINDEIITKSYDFKIDSPNTNTTKQVILDSSETKPMACNLTCIPAESDDLNDDLGCSGRLIFEENFNDNKLTQWTHAVYSRVYTEQAEFAAFLKDKKNCDIKDNRLHIVATWSVHKFKDKFELPDCTYAKKIDDDKRKCGPYRCTPNQWLPPMHSATLQTKGKFNFKYGRIEIRAKMPVGDWLFPYLLLQPNDTEVESDWTPHIRIAYVRGHPKLHDYAQNDIGGNILFGSVFSRMNANKMLLEYMHDMPLKSGSHYGDEFHNFTVIKHKDRIIYKVDGLTYGILTDKMIMEDINRSEYFIVLGLTAGGKLNFRDEYVNPEYTNSFLVSSPQASRIFYENTYNNATAWKQPELVIDHVHVYTTHPDEN